MFTFKAEAEPLQGPCLPVSHSSRPAAHRPPLCDIRPHRLDVLTGDDGQLLQSLHLNFPSPCATILWFIFGSSLTGKARRRVVLNHPAECVPG